MSNEDHENYHYGKNNCVVTHDKNEVGDHITVFGNGDYHETMNLKGGYKYVSSEGNVNND